MAGALGAPRGPYARPLDYRSVPALAVLFGKVCRIFAEMLAATEIHTKKFHFWLAFYPKGVV